MKVIHFAFTPLAGSPIRIVNALRSHSEIKANLVVLNPDAYGERVFQNDLIWGRDKDVILGVLESSDIIHFHHYFDLATNPFGINFEAYLAKGKKIIRQFHSHPLHISGGDIGFANKIVHSEIPQLVIAQYPERYFPLARIVPNIVPVSEPLYIPVSKTDDCVSIFYAPSTPVSAWQMPVAQRWNSKGLPETAAFLKRVTKSTRNVRISVTQNISHEQCLKKRQKSHISIDDLMSGSYHLSSLESLSQGVPTFAYLDSRTLWNIAELTGSTEHPWMNFCLEDAEKPLKALIADGELRKEVGRYSRQWMEKYWNDREMIRHYVSAYKDLLEKPEVYGKPRFDMADKRIRWVVQDMHDVVWEERRKKNTSFWKRFF